MFSHILRNIRKVRKRIETTTEDRGTKDKETKNKKNKSKKIIVYLLSNYCRLFLDQFTTGVKTKLLKPELLFNEIVFF